MNIEQEAREELQESIDKLIGRLAVLRSQVDNMTINEIFELTLHFNQMSLDLRNRLEEDSSPAP